VITNSLVRQAYSSTAPFHTEGLHDRDVVNEVMFGRERLSRSSVLRSVPGRRVRPHPALCPVHQGGYLLGGCPCGDVPH
jgi:hypothetical protein